MIHKQSLLFIESPLQLLNAYEATAAYALQNYTYIIRLSNNDINDQQMIALLKILEIHDTSIEYLSIKSKNKTFIDYLKLLYYPYKYMFIASSLDNIFIGNYMSGFFKRIIKRSQKEKIILLDDGAKTITIQNNFDKDHFYPLFTIYDMQAFPQQNIKTNRYLTITDKLQSSTTKDTKVLFLGMKLSEIGIITQKYYLELVKNISEYYKDKQIIYIAHREEDKDKISLIEKHSNISIEHIDYPVELYGIYESNIPYKVSSFYSTAIYTMQHIYKLEAECFTFDYTSSKHKNAIDGVYDYYKEHMKVISLV